MKPRSAKAKGNKLERIIAEKYRHFLKVKAQRMPTSGAMSHFKGDIFKQTIDGWKDECKNREKHSIWKEWEQTESQCSFSEKPVLFISGNNRPILAVIRVDDYFNLRKEVNESSL